MYQPMTRRPGRWISAYTALLLAAPWAALAQSPLLQAHRAGRNEVAGRLIQAKTYPFNPELTLELADRRSASSSTHDSTTDRGSSLTQEIEIGGQRRQRIAVAQEDLAAADAALVRRRRSLVFEVEVAFIRALSARELRAVAEADAALAREILDYSTRRLERGATTQIEANLAQASAGRAERSVQRANADYAAARARLAELAGGDPILPPEPVGELTLPKEPTATLADLLEQAKTRRGDLQSGQNRQLAAEAAIRLARAAARPNLTVGVFAQREEGTDDIVGATLGISLPMFNRNQGRIAEARAARERLRREQDALNLTVEQEVATAFHGLLAAQAAAQALRDQVLGTLEDNVDLLQRSLAAGRIGATQVVTLRREFVAGEREYIEALADALLARAELDLAVGLHHPNRTSAPKELS